MKRRLKSSESPDTLQVVEDGRVMWEETTFEYEGATIRLHNYDDEDPARCFEAAADWMRKHKARFPDRVSVEHDALGMELKLHYINSQTAKRVKKSERIRKGK